MSIVIKEDLTERKKFEFQKLHLEYKEFVIILRMSWTSQNRSSSDKPYELMSYKKRKEVDDIIMRWQEYITPLAEAWWKERGWTIHWPKRTIDGCHFTKT